MTFDIAMPLTLLSVTLASLYLDQKTKGKLKTAFEEKEFRVRDGVLLVGLMATMVTLIAFLREIVAPLMILFLFSYSMLLFMFTYLFTNKRWYVAIVPPISFLLPYLLFRDSAIWSDYLVNIYGVVFAILITLYLASLFTWKSTLVFTILLTIADIILVLITKWMVQAAQATSNLNLPVMIAVPVVPLIFNPDGSLGMMALGLGDFFFAGLLTIQTYKKHGKNFAFLSLATMTVSFFIFEFTMLTFWRIPFPGTLMVISGWLPLAIAKELKHRSRLQQLSEESKENGFTY